MILWAVLILQLPQVLDLPAVTKNPHTGAADLTLGRKLFAARCAGCHGPSGDGGKGANLAVAVLPRAGDDRALYKVIRYGLVDTEMPGSNMTPLEIWQVAAFVRTLGKMDAAGAAGDAKRGAELVRDKAGCLNCHSLGIEGGRLGPSLTGIGSARGPAYLRAKLLDPSRSVPEQYRLVDLTTKEGKRFTGTRLNEDNWSIQLRDMKGEARSFWKDDLASLKEERRTLMPSYRTRLSDGEIGDVVAYLQGLHE
jgi:putative heme-binding domain-containing protein